MKLTSENVNAVAGRALFANSEIIDGKPPEGAVIVDGVVAKYGFHPARLGAEHENITSMLSELPAEFQSGKGGGWSFLQACMTKDGDHWGEHRSMEMLFALGMGINACSYLLPREMWSALPGGMPYLVIDSNALDPATAIAA